MSHIPQALDYLRQNIDMADVEHAIRLMADRTPLHLINHKLCDRIYDLMEEYGTFQSLPQGWWLSEHDEETILLLL